MKESVCKNNNILIYNTLRRLGLRPNHSGIIFIVKAIQMIQSKSDIIVINDIYIEIAKTSKSFTPSQIRMAITYAINNRNEQKSIKNFKDIFNYDYDNEIFTNKDFIEELARAIKYN